MHLGILSLAVVFSTSMFLGGCAQTMTAQPLSEPLGNGKYSLKVYSVKGTDAYRQWDEESKKLCKGGFTIGDRHMIKGADGQDYLMGMISCNPEKK